MRSSRNLIHAVLVVGFALAVLASFTFIGTYQELIDIAPYAGLLVRAKFYSFC